MTIATKDFAFAVKSITGAGEFEGYASVFGVVDSQGDEVAPGAFSDSLARHKAEGTAPLMLWQHDTWAPIGVWTALEEDAKGLRVSGRLLAGVQKADEALILLRNKAIRGLSIGYREEEVDEIADKRILKRLNLLEISAVSFPANMLATVDAVKSARFLSRLKAGETPPIKDFEGFLRDAGFSKSMATRIASVGYAKAVRSDSDAAKANDATSFFGALAREIATQG